MLECSSDAAVSFQARVSKNGMCGCKILSFIHSIDSLLAPAHLCMAPQPAGRPGVSGIQEAMHIMTMPSFTLKRSTLEDVDATVIGMFNMGRGGKEYIDGQDPFLGEACLGREGEYQLESDVV